MGNIKYQLTYFVCGNCGTVIPSNGYGAGQVIVCPNCREKLEIDGVHDAS